MTARRSPLVRFHAPTKAWFEATFERPTAAQRLGWTPVLDGRSTLLFAPTGSGKTLAAFLTAIDRVMFSPVPEDRARCRVLYVSPIKALAVDVERNLRAPLAGIAAQARRQSVDFHLPEIGLRSGDTSTAERARQKKHPPDILITTPESLYLLLTSQARDTLRSVDTVIVDEIHAVAGTKRGAHLFLSLERLERLRQADGAKPLQRIGLSATQRPLDEIARLLGGGTVDDAGTWTQRPVEIVDARDRRALEVTLEVPVDDLTALPATESQGRSIWPAMHPRLVELVRAHRSTMIFVNSRRLAERISVALNEEAGEEIALAHHGSLAREQRQIVEERLKSGTLPCIVATSSLELGLDLGSVDLVLQIESPPTVASGLQRIGRASHQVGGTSKGVLFPKHRGDLLASTAAAHRMRKGEVETTRYLRNPLDVLAQQLVAAVAMDDYAVADLLRMVRQAAPFAQLTEGTFDGVLDLLAGRYPADDFAQLRARLTWDRVHNVVRARQGARSLAVVNAGTIPDRGLFGVFLDGEADGRSSRRVGELDEEMVFETREGEVVLLGASSWRITEITHDRVLVVPAPGVPGKMPFWKGDALGRSRELGEAIGQLSRSLASGDDDKLAAKLQDELGLDPRATANLIRFVRDQQEATRDVPSDRTLVIERFLDELGDWRVCLLSPFGGRVHAPLAIAMAGKARAMLDLEVETTVSDDGIVLRFPESDEPPDVARLLPSSDEVESLVVQAVGGTALFAARFRECAGRALLLPRRHPGRRSPLWATRKRAADLLEVASRHPTFPILLETYRECLQDAFDLPGLQEVLRRIESRQIRVTSIETRSPSPFAASLLFSYVGNYMYDGDAPIAERRAQALTVDHAQLRALLGQEELRELLDPEAIELVQRRLQRLEEAAPITHEDRLHDLLLSLGDLSEEEIDARAGGASITAFLKSLSRDRRIFQAKVAGQKRWVAAEDAARFRDALGTMPPAGLAAAVLEPVEDPLGDLVSRYARTHGPFRIEEVAARFGLGAAPVREALGRLVARGRVIEGAFLRGGHGVEYCDAEVLRLVKRRTLSRLRAEVEPVSHEAFARFLIEWHGLNSPRRGPQALLAAVEQLQGAPLPASVLESEILPSRVKDYRPGDLDALCAAGEVVWRGLDATGAGTGRIALYLADAWPLLAPPVVPAEGAMETKVREALSRRGASFFADLVRETGGFPADVHAALWALVWSGEVSNDTLLPLRSLEAGEAPRRTHRRPESRWGSLVPRRSGPPGSEGRWSLLPVDTAPATERRLALVTTLLDRHGVLVREAAHAESVAGGFSTLYGVLKALEDSGRVRRGYFVEALGATQFARPGADDRLRSVRDSSEEPQTKWLSACDPASPWGALLSWPETQGAARPQRVAGALVLVQDGRVLAWLGRTEQTLLTFASADDARRSEDHVAIARALASLVEEGRRKSVLVATVNGVAVGQSALARALQEEGFSASSKGYLRRAGTVPLPEHVMTGGRRMPRGKFPQPPGVARRSIDMLEMIDEDGDE